MTFYIKRLNYPKLRCLFIPKVSKMCVRNVLACYKCLVRPRASISDVELEPLWGLQVQALQRRNQIT